MADNMEHVAKAIQAFEQGEIIVVTDDDDRENEGDLFVAANLCTTEQMAFIIRHTSGIVCAPMSRDEAQRLRLDPMVTTNDAPLGTAFTITVDVKHGLTTGISAEERTNTVRALANGNMGADDFARPGHVFPLIAKEGGVLIRSGHTEACVDLCKLANLSPVGVLAELVNDDGSVKRGDEVSQFAKDHDLLQMSVADLIAWRQRREKLVERICEQTITTSHGVAQAYTYCVEWDPMQHLAVVFGDIGDGQDIPVRLHLESVLDDVFNIQPQLNMVMEHITHLGRGIIVYLREGSVGVVSNSTGRRLMREETEGHETALSREEEWREIGIGAQILQDLGVRSIRLLSTKERRYIGLEGFSIAIHKTDIIDE